MQSSKTNLILAIALICVASLARASDPQVGGVVDHAKTIDELLSAETSALSAKAHPQVDVKRVVVPGSGPAEVLDVESVWGITGAKHALLSLDGVRSTVSVGDSVGRFKVASIGGGCVELQGLKGGLAVRRPAHKKRRGTSHAAFGPGAEVERRRSCFHDSPGAVAPMGLASVAGSTRAMPLPTVPSVAPVPVPVPTGANLAPVQLPR